MATRRKPGMTANTKAILLLGALTFFLLAAWGLHQIFADLLDPLLKGLAGS